LEQSLQSSLHFTAEMSKDRSVGAAGELGHAHEPESHTRAEGQQRQELDLYVERHVGFDQRDRERREYIGLTGEQAITIFEPAQSRPKTQIFMPPHILLANIQRPDSSGQYSTRESERADRKPTTEEIFPHYKPGIPQLARIGNRRLRISSLISGQSITTKNDLSHCTPWTNCGLWNIFDLLRDSGDLYAQSWTQRRRL
jgi:hypothetical protein